MTALPPFIAPTTILKGTAWTVPSGWISTVYTKADRRLTSLSPGQTYVFNVEGENRLFVQTPNGKASTYRLNVVKTLPSPNGSSS